jgi:antirestriction protein ArdC
MKSEELQERTEKALEELVQALEAGKSETLLHYLETMSRFHRYSLGNTILIMFQKPDATNVAGFRRWKDLGRFVKKGEKGIAILAPLAKKRCVEKEKEDGTKEEVEVRRLYGFRVVHVFDVSQTEGQPLPEFAPITGDPGEGIRRMEEAVRGFGIELNYVASLGGALGVSEGGKITVLENLAPGEAFSVLAHELAHELLHRGERRQETTKTIRETEAEAVAFVVCHANGLESKTRSADYIQLYAGDKELLVESLEYIQKTASRILSALEGLSTAESELEAAAA